MSKKNFVAAAIGLLVACGPLTTLSKTADEKLLDLEQCCEKKLIEGENIQGCEAAFQAHDEFVHDWEFARASGTEYDKLKAEVSLDKFRLLASQACED